MVCFRTLPLDFRERRAKRNVRTSVRIGRTSKESNRVPSATAVPLDCGQSTRGQFRTTLHCYETGTAGLSPALSLSNAVHILTSYFNIIISPTSQYHMLSYILYPIIVSSCKLNSPPLIITDRIIPVVWSPLCYVFRRSRLRIPTRTPAVMTKMFFVPSLTPSRQTV